MKSPEPCAVDCNSMTSVSSCIAVHGASDVVADVEWPQGGDCLGRGLEVGGGEGAGGGAQMPTVPRAQDAKTILVCGLRR